MAPKVGYGGAVAYVFFGGNNQELDREPTLPLPPETLELWDTPRTRDTIDEDAVPWSEIGRALLEKMNEAEPAPPIILDKKYWDRKRKRGELEDLSPAYVMAPLPPIASPTPALTACTTLGDTSAPHTDEVSADELDSEADSTESEAESDSDGDYRASRTTKRRKTSSGPGAEKRQRRSGPKPSDIPVAAEELDALLTAVENMPLNKEGKLPCPVNGCSATVGVRNSLKRHVKAHAPRVDACPRCGHLYTRPDAVARHQRTGCMLPKGGTALSAETPEPLDSAEDAHDLEIETKDREAKSVTVV
ncbi:hypothetical protein AURDEDRAFT_125178 [Auricularia subglabra TFB-10046 SS5]|uniref:C2H2-type domain-containing protein n=1 Tax=Auricularia subglabra (strain TFB-10046 / SS5) TaxID=717982 RepID=J0WXY9_AURST|nr:hypothetical protein AURDEDRAFT_125178 [Auricularia subglabra TFB-10046 SS5]